MRLALQDAPAFSVGGDEISQGESASSPKAMASADPAAAERLLRVELGRSLSGCTSNSGACSSFVQARGMSTGTRVPSRVVVESSPRRRRCRSDVLGRLPVRSTKTAHRGGRLLPELAEVRIRPASVAGSVRSRAVDSNRAAAGAQGVEVPTAGGERASGRSVQEDPAADDLVDVLRRRQLRQLGLTSPQRRAPALHRGLRCASWPRSQSSRA